MKMKWTEAASFWNEMMKNLFSMEYILCWMDGKKKEEEGNG